MLMKIIPMLCALMCLISLNAEQPEITPIIPGERAVEVENPSRVEEQTSDEGLAEEHKDVLDNMTVAKVPNLSKNSDGKMGFGFGNEIAFTSNPRAYHMLTYISRHRATLEDGSEWKIASSDAYITWSWSGSDTVVLSPSDDYYYPFWLTNQLTGTSVRVKATIVYPNYSTCRIFAIYGNTVELDDRSIWEMSSSDFYITNNWWIGDVVIMGINTDYQSGLFPNILYDFNNNSYSRGLCTFKLY